MDKRGKKITRLTQSKLDGFNSNQIGSIQNLNGTIGGLASAGLSYGLTGEATFNILNISDFGAGASSGLLEMTLSKDRGVTARLGTGGTDLSFGTVSSSLQGIKTLNKNLQITRAANRNNMANAATALRTQYGFGDEKQLAQLEEILNGRTELKRGNGDGKAQTVVENGKRTVYLNSYKENMTREEQFALGITLGHEAYRDGIVGDAQSQFNETAEAVLGHTALAKRMQNDSLYNDMMTGLINSDMNLKNDMTVFDYAIAAGDWGAFGSYVGNNYDYSADYWRVTVNKDKYVTNVQEDGDSSIITYVDEERNFLDIDIAKGSLTEQIASKYGYKQSKLEINDLMFKEFGLNFSSNKGWYAVDKNNIYKGTPELLNIKKNFISILENNFDRQFDYQMYQEDIEKSLSLDVHSACAIWASAELNNDFLSSLSLNPALSNGNIMDALKLAKDEMFDKNSTVLSFNGLNAIISQKIGYDNYLVFDQKYYNKEDLKKNNIKYYLIKAKEKNNPNHTHFMKVSNGEKFDPDKTTNNRWWNTDADYEYYGFKPKFKN